MMLGTWALSAMTVNPLIAKIILDKLMFTKAKKELSSPAFPPMPFLCALFVLMTNHLVFKARIMLASALI